MKLKILFCSHTDHISGAHVPPMPTWMCITFVSSKRKKISTETGVWKVTSGSSLGKRGLRALWNQKSMLTGSRQPKFQTLCQKPSSSE